MEEVTVLVGIVALLALVLSIWQTSTLALLAVGHRGIGRIVFLSLASLKLWAGMATIYFIINTLFPGWSGDSDFPRLAVRLSLGVYLVVQPIVVNVALFRWRNQGDGYTRLTVQERLSNLGGRLRTTLARLPGAGREAWGRVLQAVRPVRD